MMAAGLLASLVGALSVTVLGMGTTAVMLKAAWLRDWLYHGQHLLYGVQNLSSDLKTLPAIAYSHEITGSVDAQVFHGIIVVFPLIALILTALAASVRGGAAAARGGAAAGQGDPRRGGDGPPDPDRGLESLQHGWAPGVPECYRVRDRLRCRRSRARWLTVVFALNAASMAWSARDPRPGSRPIWRAKVAPS